MDIFAFNPLINKGFWCYNMDISKKKRTFLFFLKKEVAGEKI